MRTKGQRAWAVCFPGKGPAFVSASISSFKRITINRFVRHMVGKNVSSVEQAKWWEFYVEKGYSCRRVRIYLEGEK